MSTPGSRGTTLRHSQIPGPLFVRNNPMPGFRTSPFTEIATGLQYPEGPVWLSDGSLLIVEVKGGKLTRLAPGSDGASTWQTVQSIALGGGPNGMAIGPNGAVYVCNNGGLN